MESVFRTLAMFDVMEFAPTAEEVHFFLYKGKAEITQVRSALKKSPRIIEHDGLFAFKGREQLFKLREEKRKWSKKYFRKARRYAWLFKRLPFVRGVAVCNSLALRNATKNSDIDLFIVTAKNRIFIGRLIATLVLHLLRLRRHGRKVAGRFCLSFWSTDDKLELDHLLLNDEGNANDDPYFAFWLRSLTPITGEDLFTDIIKANSSWLAHYFPHWYRSEVPEWDGKEDTVDRVKLFKMIEQFVSNYQLNRIERRRKLLASDDGIIANRDMLKFHDNDRRREFRAKWKRRLGKGV